MWVISTALPVLALGLSFASFYRSYLLKGTLTFIRPTFLGAFLYGAGRPGANDVVILPIAVANSGARAHVIRLKVIIDHQFSFHHTLDFRDITIPGPTGVMSVAMQAPTPLLISPQGSDFKLAGFTNQQQVSKGTGVVTLEIWWRSDPDEWTLGQTLQWDVRPKMNSRSYQVTGAPVWDTENFKLVENKPGETPRALLDK